MSDFDLVIRNGTVATAADTASCDIGIKDGVITTLGKSLAPGAREIDASGRLVLPAEVIDLPPRFGPMFLHFKAVKSDAS